LQNKGIQAHRGALTVQLDLAYLLTFPDLYAIKAGRWGQNEQQQIDQGKWDKNGCS
jgi:hypothetical protein